jgi:hypothetical protein
MGNSHGMFDTTVCGRQEQWEDPPEGWPQLYGGNGLQLREVRDEDRQGRLPGRPTSHWSRLAAGNSDDLGSTAVAADTPTPATRAGCLVKIRHVGFVNLGRISTRLKGQHDHR